MCICYVCVDNREAFIHILEYNSIQPWMFATLHLTTCVWIVPGTIQD